MNAGHDLDLDNLKVFRGLPFLDEVSIGHALISRALFVGLAFAVAVGAFTRPAAVLMALYTLGTSLIEHRYWTTTGATQVETMEAFYKNLSIIGGFLLLYITGAGKYSIDMLSGIAAP